MWEELLNEWSEMECQTQKFRETITCNKLTRILDLPLIKEKYSDYYNEDADTLWFGNMSYQFRQGNDTEGYYPRISIIRQHSFEDDEAYDENTAFELFHFDLKTLKNGRKAVVLCSQDTNGYNSTTYEVSLAETEKYRKAIRYFQQLEKRVFRIE